MKNTIILALLVFTFTSCDKVKQPNQNPNKVASCTLNSPIVKNNFSSSTGRKILLEDYTGHTCGNCPRAARKAESLVATYGSQIIVVANHVSAQFGAPVADTLYREEFRNPTSTEWDDFFKFSTTPGLPRGAINRVTPYSQPDQAWPTLAATAINQPQSAKLDMTTTYDPTQHLLNVKVKTTFLQTFTTSVMLSIVLTQDSIIADQKDYFPPTGSVVVDGDLRPDYVFEHLTIGAMNGTWGQLVKNSPAVNDTATINNECYLLGKCYFQDVVCVDDKHVNVVAFVYRDDTKEVLQVEKLKIR